MPQHSESQAFLSLHDIGRNFGATYAVRNVSAEVYPGETVAVLGANGAGKSTLLKLLSGWYPCAEGHITVDGFRMRAQGASIRRRLMLLDEIEPHEGNVVDTVTQALADYRVDRPGIETEVADWFERLGLVGSYGKLPSSVSKGQRFKIAMICLFLIRPQIWLLDEPFSAGLDANGMEQLEAEIKRHAEDGGIVLLYKPMAATRNSAG